MNSKIYRLILTILVVDIVFGAILVFGGVSLFGSVSLQRLGFGIVIVCGLIYLFFRLWGRKRFSE